MNYLCLRKCFVAGYLWQEGEVYSLPKDMQKDPNFRPIKPPKPKKARAPKKPKTAKVQQPAVHGEGEPTLPAVIPKGMYRCGKCEGNPLHRETSKIGKRHLKFKVD